MGELLLMRSLPVIPLLGCVQFKYVFFLPKFEYNHIHPYTFFVPLLSYVFYRNCSKYIRSYNLDMLVSMGKITLET